MQLSSLRVGTTTTMSLGFLTEAAILPRKQKSISVDKKSLVDLKSILYEKEEAIRSNQGGRGSGGGSGGEGRGGVRQPDSSSSLVDGSGELRALRGKRKASAVLGGGVDYEGKKDLFARHNKGVTARRARDEKEKVSSKRKSDQSQQALRAKAALYDRIASGEITDPGESGLLVDFGGKTNEDIALLERVSEEVYCLLRP